MKTTITTLAAAVLLLSLCSCGCHSEKKVLSNEQDTLSWAMGMSLAQTVQNGFYDFDEDVVRQAFQSTLKGNEQPLSPEAYQAACEYIGFLAQHHQRQQAQASAADADAKQQECFAKLEKENKNIIKTDEGFYYEVLRPGSGPNATEGLRIKFDFKGTNMLTSQLIEQTYGVREPVIHVLGRPMFPGLISGMKLMNAGSKFRFYFPYQLVTGANGIPPYTPVIYEVELHEIYND